MPENKKKVSADILGGSLALVLASGRAVAMPKMEKNFRKHPCACVHLDWPSIVASNLVH